MLTCLGSFVSYQSGGPGNFASVACIYPSTSPAAYATLLTCHLFRDAVMSRPPFGLSFLSRAIIMLFRECALIRMHCSKAHKTPPVSLPWQGSCSTVPRSSLLYYDLSYDIVLWAIWLYEQTSTCSTESISWLGLGTGPRKIIRLKVLVGNIHSRSFFSQKLLMGYELHHPHGRPAQGWNLLSPS